MKSALDDPDIKAKHDIVRRMVVRGGTAAIVKSVGALLAFLAQIVVARALGVSDFGAFAFVTGVVNFAVIFARLGLETVALRFVAIYVAENRADRYYGFQFFAAVAVVTAGFLVALVATWLLGVAEIRDESALVNLCVVLLVCIPAIGLSGVRANSLVALGPVFIANAPELIVRPLVLISGIAFLYFAGMNAAVGQVLQIFALSAVVSLMASSFWLRRTTLSLFKPVESRSFETRAWFGAAGVFVLSSTAYFALTQADILIVGAILGDEVVGGYAAAARTAFYVAFLLIAVQSTAAPMISRYYEAGDRRGTQQVLDIVGVVAGISAIFTGATAVIFADQIMALFGAQFVGAASVLRILAAGQVIRCLTGATGVTVNMTGFHREGLAIQLIFSVLGVALAIVAARHFGVNAVAIVMSSSVISWNLVLGWYLWRQTGLRCWFRPATIRTALHAWRAAEISR